jgi:hypothetical protein
MPEETPTVETIWAKVQELLTRKPPETVPEGKSIPYERFHELNQENKALREAASAWDTARKAEIARVVAEREAAHVKEKEALIAERAEAIVFARRGVDDLGQTLIRRAFETTPADKRGPAKAAAEWWEAQVAAVEAHRKDDKVPAPDLHPTLAALIPAAPAPVAPQRPGPRGPAAPPPGEKRGPPADMESLRGKGRTAVLEALGRAPPKE